jgi:hydroxymethylglutaryl-CoA reductase
MGLHARNVAASAGAQGAEIDALAALLVHRKRFDLATARETLKELRTRSVAA